MHEYTEQIQRWEDQLKAGDWVRVGPSQLDKAIIVTLARKLRPASGASEIFTPVIPNDPLGFKAKELIDA